MSYGYNGVVDW